MLRAYQSPSSGWHWGPQWAQMPNLASRNQSGHWYCWRDSQVGWNLPAAMGSDLSATGEGKVVGVAAREERARMEDRRWRMERDMMVVFPVITSLGGFLRF